MDKQNYTIKDVSVQDIKREFLKIRQKIIRALRDAGIIKRKRIIQRPSILVDAACLYIIRKLSYQRLSDEMACRYGVRMSDTAWKKQLRKVSDIFMDVMTRHMQKCLTDHPPTEVPMLLGSPKVYAIDATDISQEGDPKNIMRIHTQLRLNDHTGIRMKLTDNHTAENVANLPIESKSLYLADRAYGKAGQLAYLIDSNADFLIRITPSCLKLYSDKLCRHRLDFRVMLSGTADLFDIHAFFRHGGRGYPIRITGQMLPEEKQREAEKRVRKKAVKNCSNIRPSTILFSKWLMVGTSIADTVAGDEIVETYRQRWQIEMLFKRTKTLLGLKKRHFPRVATRSRSCSCGVQWF